MWTEKYRPKRLEDILGQDANVQELLGFLQNNSVPNMLLFGPPGTGKTSSILAFANEMYGNNNLKGNVLELNASDERKLETIRTKVKSFARTVPISGSQFKLLILDEADNLTSDAQQALRRIMEKYVRTCRFVLICNYPSKIIAPIQSRCVLLHFRPIQSTQFRERLLDIAKSEGKGIDEASLELIEKAAEGDMRRAVNVLQAAASRSNNEINTDVIGAVSGFIQVGVIKEMVGLALAGEFFKSRQILYDLLTKEGFSARDILWQLNQYVVELDIHDLTKLKILQEVAEIDYRISEGATDQIQLSSLLARISEIGDHK